MNSLKTMELCERSYHNEYTPEMRFNYNYLFWFKRCGCPVQFIQRVYEKYVKLQGQGQQVKERNVVHVLGESIRHKECTCET